MNWLKRFNRPPTHLFLIRVTANPDRVEWVEKRGDRLSPAKSGSLDEAGTDYGGGTLVVTLPATDILLTTATVPTTRLSQRSSAIPYILEEQLATPISELHFCWNQRERSHQLSVAVIARRRIETIMEQFHRLGLSPDWIISEASALPYRDNTLSLYHDDGCTLIRFSKQLGAGFEWENHLLYLASLLYGNQPAIENIDLYNTPAPIGRKIEQLARLPVSDHESTPLAPLLADNFHPAHSINLLLDAGPQNSSALTRIKPWIPAAVAATLLVPVILTTQWIENRQLQQQLDQQQQQIESIFRSTFPDSKQMVKPELQMERRLQALKADKRQLPPSIFPPLAALALTINKKTGVELTSLQYRNNRLSAQIKAPTLQHLEQIKQLVAQQPEITGSISNILSSEGVTDATITLTGTQ